MGSKMLCFKAEAKGLFLGKQKYWKKKENTMISKKKTPFVHYKLLEEIQKETPQNDGMPEADTVGALPSSQKNPSKNKKSGSPLAKNRGGFLKNALQQKNEKGAILPLATWSRSSTILPSFISKKLLIYNGKNFVEVNITEAMVGYKLGEFARTRTRGKDPRPVLGKGRSVASRRS